MTAIAPESARENDSIWRPMVLAMGKTGGASLASGLLSALGTKMIAATLGPGSIALLQTLQQLRDGAVTAATANGKTALVRGASSFEGVERREYLRTVALCFLMGTLLVCIGMMVVPAVALERLPLSMKPLVGWLAVTVALLSAFVFLTGVLNALKEIGKLALLQIASPFIAAIIAWPVAVKLGKGHSSAMMLFLAIPAAGSVAAAWVAIREHRAELVHWFQGPGQLWSAKAARGFFSISGAMLVSGLAATGTLLGIRVLITRAQGLAMTGQFDAAWNISMNHVTLILASVQAYYLPSLAAARSEWERVAQMRSMLILAVLAAVPMIVALASLKPLVVGLLYSSQFTASPSILRWTLVGDYMKVTSWVLATPMIASGSVGPFLMLDLLTQVVFWGVAILLARIIQPAESAAIGFLISYAIYFGLCYAFARVSFGFRFGAAGSAAWLTGLALVAAASANAWGQTEVNPRNSACWISLAVAFSAGFAAYMGRRDA